MRSAIRVAYHRSLISGLLNATSWSSFSRRSAASRRILSRATSASSSIRRPREVIRSDRELCELTDNWSEVSSGGGSSRGEAGACCSPASVIGGLPAASNAVVVPGSAIIGEVSFRWNKLVISATNYFACSLVRRLRIVPFSLRNKYRQQRVAIVEWLRFPN